jgi:hypothetical protein
LRAKPYGSRKAFCSESLNDAVSQIAKTKHGKLAEVDYPRILEQVGNVLHKLMADKVLGYFEDIRRMPFSMNQYAGHFRNACGQSSPFIDFYYYQGPENYPTEYVFIFDISEQRGLSLYPMILRGLDSDRHHYLEPDFFVFDIAREHDMEFKAVQERQEVTISSKSEYAVVYDEITRRLEGDQLQHWIKGIQLKPRNVE